MYSSTTPPLQVTCIAMPSRMATDLISEALNAVQEKSVKKGRLFEQSEFLPFSFATKRSSGGNAALIFSFGIFFFCIKAKEKYKE